MSARTAPSLERIDALLPSLKNLPPSPQQSELVEAAEALRRAVAAFHMEAIRFRMFTVDRLLKVVGDDREIRARFDAVREALETAGFHTRSHSAP